MADPSRSEREHPRTVQDCARYDFLEFELDLATAELRKRGVPVALRPRSLEALVYLVRHRERVVSQQELFGALWPDVTVGQGSLRQAIWEIRHVLADTGGEERVINTLRGRGYRFIAAVREQAADARPAQAGAQPAGFFGRGRELLQLKAALDAGSQVAGRACLVVGAAGAGKSRLARELILCAQQQGLDISEAYADPDGAAPALWPWLQLLTSCLARVGPERRAACQRLAPAVFRILEQPALGAGCADARAWELDADSPGQQRFRLIDELGRLFRELLSDTPRLLVLDDLQWADEPSLAFLAHFAQVLPQTRALLVVTARAIPRGQNRPLARALSVLMRGSLNQRIDLANLGVDDITRMLEAHTQDRIPTSLALAVHALSQGNPLFALELSRLLSGTCAEQRERVLHEQTEVHTIIRRRLERLPESGFEAVLGASILAPEFGVAELAGVLDEPPSATVSRLEHCLASGVLVEDASAGRYWFAHPLVRDAAYGCVTPSLRIRLHRNAGEWLERHGAGASSTCLHELAHHFLLAAPSGVASKAVHYATRCAERAYAATAYASAVSYYDRAMRSLHLAAHADPIQRLELELARGEAMRAAGEQTEEVNQLFLSIAERASAFGNAELFARAALGYAGQRSARFTPTRFLVSVSGEEVALLERALLALGPAPSELRALLLCGLVFALIYSVDRRRRERLAGEALALAHQLQIPALTVRVLLLQIYACAAPDEYERRIAVCDELVELSRAHGLVEQEVVGRVSRALFLLSLGDVDGAARDEQRAKLLAEELGSPRVLARSQLLELLRAFAQGDLPAAERLSQHALEVANDDASEQMLHVVRMSVLRAWRAGDLVEAIAVSEQMLASYPDALACRCALAGNYAMLGQREPAMRHFDWVARDDFTHLPEAITWFSEMASLADAAAWLEDPERARLIYAQLLPHGHVFVFYAGGAFPAGPVALYLGRLATAMGEFERAEEWLARARALCEKLGARMYTHFVAVSQARLLALSRPRELARARALLDEATAFAEPAGLGGLRAYAHGVRCELAALPNPATAGRATRSDPHGPVAALTAPEVDAAHCVLRSGV